ncbi:MAG: PDDEXK nuclease domain-containing protein [bacterium]
MSEITKAFDKEYNQWLGEIKEKVKGAQIRAQLSANTELLNLYWFLGKSIIGKLSKSSWGSQVVEQLSKDLKVAFPNMSGFSRSNLFYMKKWVEFYSHRKIQQLVGQFGLQSIQQLVGQIPWGHNVAIITKAKSIEEALFYIGKTIENNWSRGVLLHQIDGMLYARQGKSITNFHCTLPAPHSERAEETLKDPYIFDFMTLTEKVKERDIENKLIYHIKEFLLELGNGFSFIGNQYHIEIAGKDYFIDLLFYHIHLRCFIVIEIKTVEFLPEYAGKLNFYLSAVDDKLKSKHDNPTIGLILCKCKDKLEVEYALKDINKPIGVSNYKITQSIPEELKSSLPSIEQFERGLLIDDE